MILREIMHDIIILLNMFEKYILLNIITCINLYSEKKIIKTKERAFIPVRFFPSVLSM